MWSSSVIGILVWFNAEPGGNMLIISFHCSVFVYSSSKVWLDAFEFVAFKDFITILFYIKALSYTETFKIP